MALINVLKTATGITSYGITARVSDITSASYTYTEVDGVPVFVFRDTDDGVALDP